MAKYFHFLLVVGINFLISGCAHKIDIAPKLDTIRETKVNQHNLNVAYFISDADKKLEVTTPGGGGDKVKYTPYADTEGALNAVLSNVFKKVYSIKSLEDKAFIADKNITYIFEPRIMTTSSSPSPFTWPPTMFTVELTCKALNPQSGDKLWQITTNAIGLAEFQEFQNDFGLSAKRASEEAFLKMLKELAQSKNIQK